MDKSILVLAVCVLVCAGCGSDDKKLDAVMEEEASLSGMPEMGSVELPEGFPSDLYLYAGAEKMSVTEVPEGFAVVLATKDAAAKIREACVTGMEAKGWEAKMNKDAAGTIVQRYVKGRMSVSLSIGTDDDWQAIEMQVNTP